MRNFLGRKRGTIVTLWTLQRCCPAIKLGNRRVRALLASAPGEFLVLGQTVSLAVPEVSPGQLLYIYGAISAWLQSAVIGMVSTRAVRWPKVVSQAPAHVQTDAASPANRVVGRERPASKLRR